MSIHLLIITEQQYLLSDLINCYINKGVHVTTLPFHKVEHDKKSFDDYNFILYHATMHESFDYQVLNHIEQFTKWPIFVLLKEDHQDLAATYMENGAEGYFLLNGQCDLIFSKTVAVIRYIKENVHRNDKLVAYGDLVIDLNNRTIKTNRFSHKLTINEYYIIKVLLAEANRVVSKDQIIAKIWDDHSSATDNALGIHISRLRKKTVTSDGKQLIETVWGVGYRLNLDY